VETFFGVAGVPSSFFDLFEVENILSAFTTQEFIALANADAFIETVTVVKDGTPVFEAKDVFADAAAGFVQIYGFSVALGVATAAGAVDFAELAAIENAGGLETLPTQPGLQGAGRRKLAQEVPAGEERSPFWTWLTNRDSILGDGRDTAFVANHVVTPEERERLVAAGFFDLFGAALPGHLSDRFGEAVRSDPSLTHGHGSQHHNGSSSPEYDEYEYDDYGEETLVDKYVERIPTVEPILDVEFVLAVGSVTNNALAAVELTFPSFRFAPGFFAIAAEADPFVASFVEIDKITALEQALIVVETAAANETLSLLELNPKFLDLEAAIYILLREQISVNGADITAVL